MSEYRRAGEYIPKFLCYLQEKHVLKDYKIKKDVARTIYMEEFKPIHNITKFPFAKMFSFMRFFRVMKYNKDTDMMTFQADTLNYITPETDFSKRKTFKIAPLLRAQQTSKVDPKPSIDEPSVSSQPANRKNKKVSDLKDCKVCSLFSMSVETFKEHQDTDRHKIRMDYLAKAKTEANSIQDLLAEVVNDHGGGLEPVIVRLNEATGILLKLVNRTSQDYTIVKIIEINSRTSSVSIQNIALPKLLAANSQIGVNINLSFSEDIFWHYPIIFKLKKVESGEEIDVLKELEFHVYSSLVDDLRPTGPYKKPPKPVIFNANEEIIRGEHPERRETDFKPAFVLPKYALPDSITVLLNADLQEFTGMTTQQHNILRDINILLARYAKIGTLNKENYFKMLQLCLMMEEHQMRIDIRRYDAENQKLTSPVGGGYKPNCLQLTVPGLAEHRPSLLLGDSVLVKESKTSKTYEGIVHKVNLNNVILGFSRRFTKEVHIQNKPYFVSFTFNRVTLRAENQAVELARTHNVIYLLCSEKIETRLLKDYHIRWYNTNIENNIKQQQAVKYILSETSSPMPYLIFGPPGTGKTVTVVEAILQIWKIKENKNILVCAPSNSAANEITKRLIQHVPQRDLFRYVARSYPYNLIDADIQPYTNHDEDGYYHPSITELLKRHIVITTLVTASRLVNGGTPANHFSYVFIDESGQATESETLIPISGILTSAKSLGSINGQIVLAGDPKQLGPIIHSKRAEKYGFGISMLERLMTSNPIYQKKESKEYNDAVLTKLVKSYRSHPAILDLPNKLFYDGELVPAGERIYTHIAENWEELPNKKFPIIFHSVMGKDEQEENSPSFFNIQEIDVVANYLERLIGGSLSGMRITEKHIGVITPYRKQVQKLRQMCNKRRWTQLSIGSVEQFQGQERLVIIVSTVRSKPEFMKHDAQFHLGFLRNPKRFNVAITRAKALLIVVGNPDILQYDEYWGAFIKYCKANGACTGTRFELSAAHQNSEYNSVLASSFLATDANANIEDGPNFSRGNV